MGNTPVGRLKKNDKNNLIKGKIKSNDTKKVFNPENTNSTLRLKITI